MSKLHKKLAQTWLNIQDSLFPWLAEELGELTEKKQKLVRTLEMILIEEFILSSHGFAGRPSKDRGAIARAFVAKMIYNMPTTCALLDRLKTDVSFRRICGWERILVLLLNFLNHSYQSVCMKVSSKSTIKMKLSGIIHATLLQ